MYVEVNLKKRDACQLPHAGMIQIRSKGSRNLSVFLSQPKLLDSPSYVYLTFFSIQEKWIESNQNL